MSLTPEARRLHNEYAEADVIHPNKGHNAIAGLIWGLPISLFWIGYALARLPVLRRPLSSPFEN